MIVAFCYVILALSLLALPFAFTFDAGLSVFDAGGAVSAKLFGIVPLVKINANVENDGGFRKELVLRIGRKEKRFHINADKNDEKSVAKFMKVGFIPYINIVDLDVVEIGKRNDALFTTFALGTVRTAAYGFLSYLKSSQKLEVRERFVAVYNRDVIRARVVGIINVSVADIIFAYLLYVFSGKSHEYRRNLNDNRA